MSVHVCFRGANSHSFFLKNPVINILVDSNTSQRQTVDILK